MQILPRRRAILSLNSRLAMLLLSNIIISKQTCVSYAELIGRFISYDSIKLFMRLFNFLYARGKISNHFAYDEGRLVDKNPLFSC